MTRILYSGTRNASSWAFRAWLALREAEVPFEEHVVDIRRPQRFANLARIGQISPAAGVPVLVDGDTVIFDSLAIMEYASDLAGGTLLPRELKARARVRSLVAWQHAGLSQICADRSFESAFYAERPPMTGAERAEADRVYAVWEGELGRSGGPYLAGELSLADLAFVPTVVRLPEHGAVAARWPLSAGWTERLLGRASVREWMDAARALPPVLEPMA
jgi:glutathione S-transferase